MSLHFVTSAQAAPHVTSSDAARFNAGSIGAGGYVFHTLDKMSASMVDPNTMRILAGDACFCGRHWSITGYEDINIQNGTPGYKRIDLVVARISTAPSETMEIKVYTGEETTATPVTPSHVVGDLIDGDTVAEMPLYTIEHDGLSVSDPVALFDVLMPLWDSISPAVLYEGRTNDTFTMRDSVANYRRIEVDVVTNDDDSATFGLNDPDGKSLGITMTHASPDDLWVKVARWSFNGTTALKSGHGEVQANGSNAKNGLANIYVTKVIGYR